MAGAGEGFQWPEPKFLPVQSGAELNPARVTAAFELINRELVIGEQLQLVEMLLDGTDYTVAAPQVEGLTSGDALLIEHLRMKTGYDLEKVAARAADRIEVLLAAPPVEGLTSGEGEARKWIATHYPAAVDTSGADRLVHAFVAGASAASPKATATASVREGEAMRNAIIAAIASDRRRFNEHSPTWNAYGFCIDIAEHATLTDSGTAATIGGERA